MGKWAQISCRKEFFVRITNRFLPSENGTLVFLSFTFRVLLASAESASLETVRAHFPHFRKDI